MALNFKENGRTYLLIGLVTFLLVAPFVFLAIRKAKPAQKPTTGEYYDPGSGETVSDPAGKTPENYGGNAVGPVYLGFSKLLDIGVSQFQLDGIKSGFEQYAKSANQKIKEISLAVDSIKPAPHDRTSANPKDAVAFNVTLDRNLVYMTKVEYFDITSVQVYLYDTNNKLIYNSGVIKQNSAGTTKPPDEPAHP